MVETYLDLRDIHPKQKLFVNDVDNNPWLITRGNKKTEVVLERWLFELVPETSDGQRFDLTDIYKQCIVFFRHLYSFANLLPVTTLRGSIEAYKESGQGLVYENLKISSRILRGDEPITSKGRVGLSKELISTYSNTSNESEDIRPHLADNKFKSISTPFGELRATMQYRKDTNFYLNRKSHPDYESPENPNVKRHSLNSTQSYSPPAEFKKTLPKQVYQELEHRQSSAAAIPISGSSNLNVSLAALLRTMKRDPNSANNLGSYTGGTSLPKSFTSSHAGSYVPTHSSPNAISISPNINNTAEINSVGSQTKYSSSFGSRLTSGQVKSLIMASNPNPQPYGISRNASIEGRRFSDLEPPSQFYVDEDINDFIKLLDNKKDLKVGATNAGTFSDSLYRFRSMKNTNNLLSDSVSESALISTNSPPIGTGINLSVQRGSPQSVAMNRGGSGSSYRPTSPQTNMSHRFSLSSNSPHGNSYHLPLVPSRLSGTYFPPNSEADATRNGNDGSFHNPNSYSHSLHKRRDSNGSLSSNSRSNSNHRHFSLPAPIDSGVNIPGFYKTAGSPFKPATTLNYNIGSAPLPIASNRFVSSHQNQHLGLPGAFSYNNGNNANASESFSAANEANNHRQISNRYKPTRHPPVTGFKILPLQNFEPKPSMAITTTTNAYAKMSEDSEEPVPELVAQPQTLEEDAYYGNIDDDLIFPVHDIDINRSQ